MRLPCFSSYFWPRRKTNMRCQDEGGKYKEGECNSVCQIDKDDVWSWFQWWGAREIVELDHLSTSDWILFTWLFFPLIQHCKVMTSMRHVTSHPRFCLVSFRVLYVARQMHSQHQSGGVDSIYRGTDLQVASGFREFGNVLKLAEISIDRAII
jgi:hypothetical protein